MIYKLGSVKDLDEVAGVSVEILSECRSYLEILDAEYGADRDIDRDDGGYVILTDSKASDDEVREVFDYTQYLCEFEKKQETFTTRLYLVSQDYGVVIITVKEKKDDNR